MKYWKKILMETKLDKLGSSREIKVSREEANLIEELEASLKIKLIKTPYDCNSLPIKRNSFTVKKNHINGIYLQNLDLHEDPGILTQFNHLIHISFKSNNLSNIPKIIQEKRTLESINLARNNFKMVPESIFRHSKLSSLNLSMNSLENVPDSINQLKNVEMLDLSFNNLTSIPHSIGKLKKLKHLYLDGNPIKHLPESLFKKGNLKTFSVSEQNLNESSKILINQIKHDFNRVLERKIPEEKRIYYNLKKIKKLKVITAPYIIQLFYEYGGEMFWAHNDNSRFRFGSPINPYDLPISKESAEKFKKYCEIWEIKMFNEMKKRKEPIPLPQDFEDWDLKRLNNETAILLIHTIGELGEEYELLDLDGYI